MDSPGGTAAPPPVGRYGPLVHISRFDQAAEELTWQLPVNGELYRLLPGPDRPDYSLVVLPRPLHFYPAEGFDLERVAAAQRVPDRKGRPMVRVHALVVCARFVGEQLHPQMSDLPVHIAFVLDDSLARDERLDLAKVEYAGSGFLSEGHAERSPAVAPAPPAPPAPLDELDEPAEPPVGDAPAPKEDTPARVPGDDVAREAALLLRRGIEERRGRPVSRLSASFSLDEGHQVTGLRGNADGEAPEPTTETFARLNELFARLGADPSTADVRGVRVRLGEGADDVELSRV